MSEPWKCIPHSVYPGMLVVEGPESPITIITSAVDIDINSYMRRVSEAHLIAAAPDLLEALEMMLYTREAERNLKGKESPLHDRCRAAIAKAKGTQQ